MRDDIDVFIHSQRTTMFLKILPKNNLKFTLPYTSIKKYEKRNFTVLVTIFAHFSSQKNKERSFYTGNIRYTSVFVTV